VNEVEIVQYTTKALMLVLILSMPPIIVASVVGTLVSLVQALTQVQEQTLSFAVKLVAVFFAILMTARWMGVELYNYSLNIFQDIPSLG